jgi:hypothetical protein
MLKKEAGLMKLRAEDRAKVKWAIGLFAFAAVMAVYNFGGRQRPGSPVPVHDQQKTNTAGTWKAVRDPALRPELFQRRQTVSFVNSRNIFAMKEEKQASHPDTGNHDATGHDGGQSMPVSETTLPIDLKFFGYFRKSGEPKKICVSQGEAIYLAQEGSLVALRYRILEIKSNSVMVQDMLSNQQQSLVLLQ